MVKKDKGKGTVGGDAERTPIYSTPRAVKVSAEAYRALRAQAKKEGKPMEEIVSLIICAVLPAGSDIGAHGEQYDAEGKRVFRKAGT